MHRTDSHRSPAGDPHALDQATLALLLDDPGLWSMEDLACALGSRVEASMATAHLRELGLLDEIDHHVQASRAARHAARLLDI